MYLVGGADYDAEQFHTFNDRNDNGVAIGALAWKFDVGTQQWTRIPDLPGTPRFVHAVACVGTKVVVVGGSTGGTSMAGGATTFSTVAAVV